MAPPNAVLALGVLPKNVAVVVVIVAILSHNSLLGLGAGSVDSEAVVVFG